MTRRRCDWHLVNTHNPVAWAAVCLAAHWISSGLRCRNLTWCTISATMFLLWIVVTSRRVNHPPQFRAKLVVVDTSKILVTKIVLNLSTVWMFIKLEREICQPDDFLFEDDANTAFRSKKTVWNTNELHYSCVATPKFPNWNDSTEANAITQWNRHSFASILFQFTNFNSIVKLSKYQYSNFSQ